MSMSPAAKRRQEQQLLEEQKLLEEQELSEIEQSNQELRKQRGIVRSPSQEVETESDEMGIIERMQTHNQSTFDINNKRQLLEHFINDNINAAVERNQENISDLRVIYEDDTITLDVTSKIVLAARNNTHWFMINSTPNYENLPLLTNHIFLISLFDIVEGYRKPNITSRQINVNERLQSLEDENFFINNQELKDLCYQNMKKLVERNIKDGALIQKEEKRKKITFGPNFYRGGKTKKRRQNRKKTQSRKPKKRLTIKRKNNKK